MTGPLDMFRTQGAELMLPRAGSSPPPSFAESWGAARQQADVLDRTDSYDIYAKQQAAGVVRALASRGVTAIETGYGRRIGITERNFASDRQAVTERIWQEVAKIRSRDPTFLADLPDRAAFDAAVTANRKRDLGAAEAVLADRDGAAAAIGGFAGAMQSTLGDPMTQIGMAVTLPLGGPISGGLARQIALSAAREAGLNLLATAPMLPWKAKNAGAMGREYGAGDIAADLGLAAAAGGLLGGAFAAAGHGLGKVADSVLEKRSARQMAALLEQVPEATGLPLTPVEKAAAVTLRREAEDLRTSPFQQTPEGDATHLQQVQDSTDALLTGEPLPPPPADAPPMAGMSQQRLPGKYRVISAADLQTDAATFQYKTGGDAAGVTDRLANVTQWNPDAAGAIMVWERADGTLFVADGHQRTGLAKRLIRDGHAEDVGLLAHVYREADGVTAEQAMLRAAGANILAGTGDALDAAKIIRRVGAESQYLRGMDGTRALARDAMGLARLSDDAFGMVLNGDAETAAIGAIVGRVAPDAPELHAQMIQGLRTADVATATQRELLLRDMLAAPRTREHQHDMFGMLEVTRGLWAERARILERTLETIRRARRALASAADNADTLEAAGGKVDRTRAASVADENARMATVVERLARVTDNPVNEALSRAATAMAEGKRADAAARDFLAEIRAQPDIIGQLAADAADAGARAADAGTGAGDAGLAGRHGPDPATQGRPRAGEGNEGARAGEPDAGAAARNPAADHAIADFSDPQGAAAAAQADHLLHDMRAAADAPEEPGGLFSLFDEDEPALRAVVDEIDADQRALHAMTACLKGGAA